MRHFELLIRYSAVRVCFAHENTAIAVKIYGTLITKKANASASAFHIPKLIDLTHDYNNSMIFSIFEKWNQIRCL